MGYDGFKLNLDQIFDSALFLFITLLKCYKELTKLNKKISWV